MVPKLNLNVISRKSRKTSKTTQEAPVGPGWTKMVPSRQKISNEPNMTPKWSKMTQQKSSSITYLWFVEHSQNKWPKVEPPRQLQMKQTENLRQMCETPCKYCTCKRGLNYHTPLKPIIIISTPFYVYVFVNVVNCANCCSCSSCSLIFTRVY